MTNKDRYLVDPDLIDISPEEMEKVWRMVRPKFKPKVSGKIIITGAVGENNFNNELFYGKEKT